MALSFYDIKNILNSNKLVSNRVSNNIKIIDSYAIYDENSDSINKRKLKYLCYEIETLNPDTGETYHFYKAIKFARIIRIPKASKQSTSFMDMHQQVLSAVYEQKINLVTIIANVIKPVSLGLLYLYGVQGVADNIAKAKEIADNDFISLMASLQGTYRVLEMRVIQAQESEWLREKIFNMDFITIAKGIPKANKSGEDMGNKGIGGKNLNPDSQGTLEEFIAGMADYEYVIEVLNTPVPKATLQDWSFKLEKDMTDWNSQLQGTKSLSFNISIPMMYAANQSTSQGWNKAYADASSTGHSIGESFTQSFGENVGESLSQSYGHTVGQTVGQSYGESLSHSQSISQGHTVGNSLSHSLSSGTSQNVGFNSGANTGASIGQNIGQSLGQSIGQNTGMSHNVGNSQNVSLSDTYGASNTNTHGISQGQSYNQSFGQNVSNSHNVGTSYGTSFNQGTSISQSNSATVGTTDGYSQGSSFSHGTNSSSNSSSSVGTSLGQNFGLSSGSNSNTGSSHGKSNSHSDNSSSSFNGSISVPFIGANIGGSLSSGSSDSSGTSSSSSDSWGLNDGNSYGISYGNSAGYSNGYSSGTSDTMGLSNSVSHSNSVSQSASVGRSDSMSVGQSWGANESFGTSYGKSYNEGFGVNYGTSDSQSIGQSHSMGMSQGYGANESYGASVGQSMSNNMSNSLGASQSQNVGQSIGQSLGYGVNNSESYGATQSVSDSVTQSQGITNGVSRSMSQSQSVSNSMTRGTSQSYGQSQSISNGNTTGDSTSRSQTSSLGNSGAYVNGASSSMGFGPSIGYNKSYQWKDQQVQDILEMLEYENERYKKSLRGEGAFYTYLYIGCPSRDALAAAKATAKSTWQNQFAITQPLQILDLTKEEQNSLLTYFTAFSADISKEKFLGEKRNKYSTILLPSECVAYTHLPRISEGGVFADVNDIPKFAVPSMMEGEIYMGTVLSAERYTMLNGYRTQYDFKISEKELMHGYFTGASRSGKTVAAMRFVAELSKIRRSETGKRLRIVCMDPKKDWRTLARFVEPERFRFYSLGNASFHPIKINPLIIPRGVIPQTWIDGIIDIYCRAYGLLERGKQMMGETIYKLYEEQNIFEISEDDPDWEEKVHELSKNVTFQKVYNKMLSIKVELEDPHNSRGRAGNDTRDAYARLLDRLQAFSRPYSIESKLFGTSEGIGVDDMIGNDDVTVLESSGLEKTFKNFIFGIITSGFYKWAKSHEGGFLGENQFETVLVIEEANEVLIGNDAAGSGGGSSMGLTVSGPSEFEEILDQSAGYGLFIIAITQKIADMPKSIIANSGLVFAGRLKTEKDIQVVIRSIGREERYDDRDVLKFFPRMETGMFICQRSRTFDFKDAEPILVSIARLNIAPPSNLEIEQILTNKQLNLNIA